MNWYEVFQKASISCPYAPTWLKVRLAPGFISEVPLLSTSSKESYYIKDFVICRTVCNRHALEYICYVIKEWFELGRTSIELVRLRNIPRFFFVLWGWWRLRGFSEVESNIWLMLSLSLGWGRAQGSWGLLLLPLQGLDCINSSNCNFSNGLITSNSVLDFLVNWLLSLIIKLDEFLIGLVNPFFCAINNSGSFWLDYFS